VIHPPTSALPRRTLAATAAWWNRRRTTSPSRNEAGGRAWRRIGRIAAATLLAILLLEVVILGATAGRSAVAIVAPDRSCRVVMVSPEKLAEVEAALAEEAARIQSSAELLMAEAAAVRLAIAREQVPGFGDWAYGWVQSYVTSYRILGRVARGLAQSVVTPMPGTLLERIAEDMAAPIRDEFRARILAPAAADGGIAADYRHVGEMLDAMWLRALQAAAAALDGPEAGPTLARTAPRLDLAAAAGELAPVLAALAPDDPLELIGEEGADTATVFLRSMRPMAARVGSILVRATEAGSLIAGGGAFGYALAGLPGVAAGVATGVTVTWGLDWLINRVDAALNRSSFEAQALEAIERAEKRIANGAAEAAGGALAERRAALRPGATGCG
jgi:uncharacterized protein YukE